MRLPGPLLLLGAALALGIMHVLEKRGIAAGAEPMSFAVARCMAALAAVLAVWGVVRPDGWTEVRKPQNLARLAIVGSIASGAALVLSLIALTTTAATNKGVITALYPAATVGFAWGLYGRRPPRAVGLALGCIVIGLGLLTSRGLAEAPHAGDLLLLLTVPMIGFTDAYAERALSGISPLTLTVGRYGFGLGVVVAAVFVLEGGVPLDLGDAWIFALLAGLAAGIGITALYAGIDRCGPTTAALLVSGAPVVTLVAEGLLLGTWPGAGGVTGVALVLGGVLLTLRSR